ncbi:alpha-L-rhamnosidase [Colletotrichum orchidophilum]|uniref:Alpha-L-rhamnosidase n=1 Tax=Colletotrichum orchidophilum TaxID=1209926 RepID=A0A1G4BBA4_9PEZI|nr:alpha-L-rhamnosidase [Colletotrichum orchidophilum]OHE98606.1 alpha-L-rhamnosidase [Colletotrichum orchidophilum]
MGTFRVNQYNITNPSLILNRLVQGVLRHQTLKISSTDSLQLRIIGVKSTTSTTPLTRHLGSFVCSDEDLDLTLQGLAGTVAAQLLYYPLDVQAKPVRGGFGISVLCETLNSCVCISFNLSSRTVTAHAGSTSLDNLLATSLLPSNTTLGAWYTVHIDVVMAPVVVTLNLFPVLNLTETPCVFGSFGFGASFGHPKYFHNLIVSALAGEIIYTNLPRTRSFLPDFMMGANRADTIVDRSPRDRIAYTGELDVALNAAFASTFGTPSVDLSLDVMANFDVVYAYSLYQSLLLLPDAGVNVAEYQTCFDKLHTAINANL